MVQNLKEKLSRYRIKNRSLTVIRLKARQAAQSRRRWTAQKIAAGTEFKGNAVTV